jgi:hypothetical protein
MQAYTCSLEGFMKINLFFLFTVFFLTMSNSYAVCLTGSRCISTWNNGVCKTAIEETVCGRGCSKVQKCMSTWNNGVCKAMNTIVNCSHTSADENCVEGQRCTSTWNDGTCKSFQTYTVCGAFCRTKQSCVETWNNGVCKIMNTDAIYRSQIF